MLEHLISSPTPPNDVFDIIFPMISTGQLEHPNIYSNSNHETDLDQVRFADYNVSSYLTSISKVNKHTHKLFMEFVEKKKKIILSRIDTWSWCIEQAHKLTDPGYYVTRYEEIALPGENMFPVHSWLESNNHKIQIVRIVTKEISSLTIRRETDEDNRELHYITTVLKLLSPKDQQFGISRENVPVISWLENLDIPSIDKCIEDVLEKNIKTLVREEVECKFGVTLD